MIDWSDYFVADETRLLWQDDGIVVDRRVVADGQVAELELRDSVAAPFVTSPQAAIHEATRHHARGPMLARASELADAAGKDGVILDAGCGFGWHWIDLSLARPDLRFILLDFSAVNLRVCRNLMPFSRHPNVLCVQASALDLPLRDEVVSVAWTVQVLQHLHPQQRARAFEELRRVLRVDGTYYIAWLRRVPMTKAVFRLFGKRYHEQGETSYGLYLDRFGTAVEAELRRVFPSGVITLSESLFHPELRLRPRSRWLAPIDALLSASPAGTLMARQAEFRGRK